MKLRKILNLIDFSPLKVRILCYQDEQEYFAGFSTDISHWMAEFKLAKIPRLDGSAIEYVSCLGGESQYSEDAGFIIYVDGDY